MITKNAIKHGILLTIFLGLITWNSIKNIHSKEINEGSDAGAYIRMAYHVFHHHTFSQDTTDDAAPSNWREPGYPLYMAIMMNFSSNVQNVSLDKICKADGGLMTFRYFQVPIMVLLALNVWVLTYIVTKKGWASYLALLLVGTSNSYLILCNEVKRECLMGLLLVNVVIFLFLTMKYQHKKYFVLLGLSLSALVLTNAVFQYFIFFLVLLFFFVYKREKLPTKQFWIAVLLCVVAYLIPTCTWMTRNKILFDRFFITGRGGMVLAIRAEYDKMTSDEYWGSFIWWTPDPLFQSKAAKVMQTEGRWVKLHRSNPQGYYKTGLSGQNFVEPGETFENDALKDKTVQKRAVKEILSHPFKHCLTTIPFAWRGIFVEYGYMLHVPCSILVRSIVAVSIFYFASLLFWFVYAYRKRNWPVFAIAWICIYLYGMDSFLTHGLPRYSQPLIPVLVFFLMLTIHHFTANRRTAAGS